MKHKESTIRNLQSIVKAIEEIRENFTIEKEFEFRANTFAITSQIFSLIHYIDKYAKED